MEKEVTGENLYSCVTGNNAQFAFDECEMIYWNFNFRVALLSMKRQATETIFDFSWHS